MEFFKSVFPTSQNSQTTPAPSSSSMFQTIANDYFKDLQEFTSTLKQETSLLSRAASRAVHDLPARLDSGAAIAQVSLEAVGDVIDNVGSTLSHAIIGNSDFINAASNVGKSGKDYNFIGSNVGKSGKDYNFNGSNVVGKSGVNVTAYSRLDAMISGLQCDVKTYCEEIEENGYDEWRTGFRIDEKREEIEKLLGENGVIGEIYNEVVPKEVDENTFWCRYFYRVDKVIKREEVRLQVVKRASLEEEEELSWDFDDDDDEYISKGKMKQEFEDKVGVSGEKGDTGVYGESVEEGLKVEEKAGSEGRIGSDFSVISSQRSSHVGEDFGWDEIEDIGSGYESKVIDHGHGIQHKEAGLQKQLSDEEELTWDVKDDDQPIKT